MHHDFTKSCVYFIELYSFNKIVNTLKHFVEHPHMFYAVFYFLCETDLTTCARNVQNISY